MHAFFIALLALLSLQALGVHLSAAPRLEASWTSEDGTEWTGYNPDCELACAQSGGEACDSYPKTCCSHGECTTKFNITTCATMLHNFSCRKPVKRGVVFASPDVPELSSVNQ